MRCRLAFPTFPRVSNGPSNAAQRPMAESRVKACRGACFSFARAGVCGSATEGYPAIQCFTRREGIGQANRRVESYGVSVRQSGASAPAVELLLDRCTEHSRQEDSGVELCDLRNLN